MGEMRVEEMRVSLICGVFQIKRSSEEVFIAEVGPRFGRQYKRRRPRKDGVQKIAPPISAKERGLFSLFRRKYVGKQGR